MRYFLPLLILLFAYGCYHKDVNQNENKPESQAAVISTDSPASVGVNDSILDALTIKIKEQYYPNIHSLLIAKDGKLIYEEYFEGEDRTFGTDFGKRVFNDTILHDVRSVSKSVTSALVGICIDKGLIKNVNQPISDFFPEYKFEGEKSDWTIEHFLTMTSGLDWNERVPLSNPENDETKMALSEDPVSYVFRKHVVEEPGTKWNYCGGNTRILGEIVQRTSEKQIDEFARENLFLPIGIEDFEWNKYSLFGGVDVFAMASGLRLRPVDMLKFALLYRNKGNWNGAQVLSENWIEESFSRKIDFPCDPRYDCTNYYGYQFWLWTENIMGKDVDLAIAMGNGDQRIYWDLENDLIVVVTAGNYSKTDIQNNSYAMLQNEIYPAVFEYNAKEAH